MASNFKEFLRKNGVILVLAGFVILAFFFMARYIITQRELSGEIIQAKTDTIRQIEYKQGPIQYIDRFIPTEIRDTVLVQVKVPVAYHPTGDDEELKRKLVSLSNEHFSTRKYSDSLKLTDSSGFDVGVVNIRSEVKENKLKSMEASYNLKTRVETTTITNTNTIIAPPTRKLLVGIEGSYTQATPVNTVGLGIMYQDRQNRLMGVSTGLQFLNKQQYYKLSFYAPISLRKKK